MTTPPTPKIRSALFVDFDNIYIRLSQQDTNVAAQFATAPGQWLAWLEQQLNVDYLNPNAAGRNILVRRCYLNPRVFQKYRPYFIRSAFEVVDCPPLTSQGKTSADIRMVMDILDMLDHQTHFDEFIIFSGDADFTPVLLRLRKCDRRSVVLAIGPASPAYSAASDFLIEQDDFVEHAIGLEEAGVQKVRPRPTTDPALTDEIRRYIRQCVQNSTAPIILAKLAQEIGTRWREQIVGTDWLGFGTFKDFLVALDLDNLEISPIIPGYVYDPNVHQPPQPAGTIDDFTAQDSALARLARKIHQLTDTPYLTPQDYSILLQAMADEINENGYNLNQTSKAVRDRCVKQDAPIARSHVNFALRGIAFTGYRFGRQTESAFLLGQALATNTLNLCEAAQLDLSREEIQQIQTWITGTAVDLNAG